VRKKTRLISAALIAASFGLAGAAIQTIKAQQLPLPHRSMPLISMSGTQVLDWSRINFVSFGGMHSTGRFIAPPQLIGYLGFNPSVSWSKGTPVSQVIRLGFVEQAFALQRLNLDKIVYYTGTDLQRLPLSAYGILKWQTIGTLVQAIPELSGLYISQVPPIATLVRSYVPFNVTVGQLLKQQPAVAQLPLTDILNQYNIKSIPGLSTAKIERFHRWQAVPIAEIPGLANLAFSHFPIQPIEPVASLLPPPARTVASSFSKGLPLLTALGLSNGSQRVAGVAIFDGPYEGDGYIRTNVITGSDRVGFNYPCDQSNCGHIKLGYPFDGARFISGAQQWVPGGHNLLGRLFGSLEPTGRPLMGNPNPAAEPFKLVLNWADDETGTAAFGLAMHWCIHHVWPDPLPNPDCTPYVFEFPGIWLWQEQQRIFIGAPGRSSS
jgi:hypothetical protein